MSSYVFINSNDRLYYASSTPSNFTALINTASSEIPKSHVSLESITFYNLEYGINSNNNTLIFQENGVAADISITITPGNYTDSTYIAALKAEMDAAGANTYTVTYNATTSKLSITTTIPDTFKLVGGTMLDYMGFEVGTSFQTAATGDYPLILSGTTYVDLCLGLLNRNMKTGRNYGRIFARIPVNVNYGSLVSYVNSSDSDDILISTESLDEYRVELFNDRGYHMVLPTNCIVSIVLKVETIL